MRNDYYDFNPSAATWTLMLTAIVVFVVALCVLLIYFISRSEAMGTGRPHLVRRVADLPDKAGAESRARAAAPVAQPTKAASRRWTAAAHRHA